MMLTILLLFYLTNSVVVSVSYGDLRLVDGAAPTRGRLEVYMNKWGTVCDDHFNDVDAVVACRQLGYRVGESLGSTVIEGTDSTSILMDDVKCNGGESKLIYCNYTKDHDCGHSEDVGIACYGINGGWSSWSSWSSCSNACGYGRQYKSRRCNNPVPDLGGGYCFGSSFITQTCRSSGCTAVDGSWGSWNSWSGCSVTCGTGSQHRFRKCNNPIPNYGGSGCSGSPIGTKNCFYPGCGAWNGGWSNWSEWSRCSASCGNGTQHKYRRCNNPPPNDGGTFCGGATVITQFCSVVNCSDMSHFGQSFEQSLPLSTKISIGVSVGCFIAVIVLSICLYKCRLTTTGAKEIQSGENYDTLHKNHKKPNLRGFDNTELTESQAIDEPSVGGNSKTEETEEQYENLEIK